MNIKLRKGQTLHKCQYCGDNFISDFKANINKYCSKKCYGLALKDKITKKCAICGETFETTKSQNKIYCSRKCYGASKLNHELLGKCECCGREYKKRKKSQKYCGKVCMMVHRHKVNRGEAISKIESVTLHKAFCKCCGKEMKVEKIGNNIFCSLKCMVSSNKIQEATKKEINYYDTIY